jgi:hypothetical protein
MIAGSEHIQAHGEQLFGDGGSDAEAAGRVFGVGDGEVDVVGGLDVLEMIGDNVAPRRGEDIADEKDVHDCVRVKVTRRRAALANIDTRRRCYEGARGRGGDAARGRSFCGASPPIHLPCCWSQPAERNTDGTAVIA